MASTNFENIGSLHSQAKQLAHSIHLVSGNELYSLRFQYCRKGSQPRLHRRYISKANRNQALAGIREALIRFTYLARRPVYFLPPASTAPMLPLLPPALALSQIVPATSPTIQVRK